MEKVFEVFILYMDIQSVHKVFLRFDLTTLFLTQHDPVSNLT